MRYELVPLSRIAPDPKNVRQRITEDSITRMADSIAEYGLLENLVVRENPSADGVLIVGGERRYRGFLHLVKQGKVSPEEEIMCVVVDGAGTFENLVENLGREEVDPWDLGFRFIELMEAGYPQAEIGARIGGKSQGYVSRLAHIARGIHPANIAKLRKMTAKLTTNDLVQVASLTLPDKSPDEKAQLKLIEEKAGTRIHRKKRKAVPRDSNKTMRRLTHLRFEMQVPAHAKPYVDCIVNYLLGLGSGRSIKFPEEL